MAHLPSIEEMDYHLASEKLVDIICHRTQTTEPLFFRVLVGYYFAVAASHMRCSIATPDMGEIPVNMYALDLAPSGFGKGRAINIIENEVLGQFRSRFVDETFQILADDNLPKLGVKRANRRGTDPDDELQRAEREFNSCGPMLFSFSEATSPAVKQLRHKLLMAQVGALSLEIDEIGLNFTSASEVLTTYLELYDKGQTKPKLVKSSSENVRFEEIRGSAPANLMMFGAPSKLFDGSVTEQQLYSFLDTGYARRCFFGYVMGSGRMTDLTPEEIYDANVAQSNFTFLEQLADRLEALADIINVNKKLAISRETSLLLIQYKLQCEREAAKLGEHDEMRRAEISHRYFKVLKLAGAYAFIDDVPEVSASHIFNAIKLAEESGQAFQKMLTRDRPFVKLAKYLAQVGRDVTQAELIEDLPFYKGSSSQKSDMVTQAIAWGYKNNVIVKKSFSDGIEFLRGESLKPVDLDKMIVSYSDDITEGYRNETAPFDQLHRLTQAQGMHWVAHHLTGGYRNEENCIPGFSMVVIDVDGGVSISTAKLMLQGYKYLLYTTKRHTEEENRFRIIFPMNFVLQLDAKDYKEFMKNIYEWLPFEADSATGQRARKWMSHNGHHEYVDGDVLDVLPFIPKTSKNEQRKELLNSQQSMDNLERWVMNNIGDGNRNNMLLRFAMILVDAGLDLEGIRQRVMSLNDKIADKLEEAEIMATIMMTVAKALAKR